MANTTIIEYGKPVASGRREGWAKHFTEVDSSARGAQAFVGDYLQEGELIDGDWTLEVPS